MLFRQVVPISTHPDNKTFHYEFDGLIRVDRLTNHEQNELLTLSYQDRGARHAITRSGCAVKGYTFDGISRLQSFSQGFTGNSHDLTTTFDYNPASQVTSLTKSNSAYQYQGNDNLSGNYEVNYLYQYTAVAGKVMGYDLNGNLTSDGGTYTYVYDDENRLTSITGANTASFEYDPLGRLYEATVNGVATQFLYYGDALVAEYVDTGNIIKRYVHGDRVDEPWVQFTGSSTLLANQCKSMGSETEVSPRKKQVNNLEHSWYLVIRSIAKHH
jgi:YD repeat-containing protein